MHNYAHNKATEKNNPCKILKLDSGKAAAVRTESGRSPDGKRPQAEMWQLSQSGSKIVPMSIFQLVAQHGFD